MPYLGIFGLEFQETIVIFEISTLKFVKNGSLTHAMNKGPGSAFSEGPDPGPGPLYKVCPTYPHLLMFTYRVNIEPAHF